MPNNDQMKYPGEERYYNQGSQPGGYITQNFGTGPNDQGPQPGGYITQNFESGPQGKLRDQPPKRRNGWKVATLVLLITTVVFFATTVLAFTHLSSPTTQVAKPTSTATQVGQRPTSGPATQAPTGATPTAPASATGTTTTPVSTSNNYLAAQPGPGCDKNGGTWTPEGPISNITCGTNGTTITIASNQSRGYLYFQLPNNEAFSQNNTIGITGNLQGYGGPNDDCVGLAEQDANEGFLVEYCGNGGWFIYSISNTGAITRILDKSITSTRTSEKISLTLQSTTLSFSIDSEMYQVKGISPIQPTKVAITYFSGSYGGSNVPVENFTYTVLPS